MIALAIILGILGFLGQLGAFRDGGCLGPIVGSVVYLVLILFLNEEFGPPAVIIIGSIGIVIGIYSFVTSKPLSTPSIGPSMRAYDESKKNDPHTCGNCTKYSSHRGECRFDGEPKSASDHCGRWC